MVPSDGIREPFLCLKWDLLRYLFLETESLNRT